MPRRRALPLFGEPTLELLPPVGPPGFVVIVREACRSDAGVGSGDREVEVTADADGQFRIPVLILPGIIWRRGRSSTEHRFPDVEAPFLVEPATVQPRDFASRS